MFRPADALRVVAIALFAVATHAQSADATLRYGFGSKATGDEIARWDIDVRPDGAGLPAGRGSVADGQKVYDAQCASCHGTFGESTDYMAIAGGVGTLGTDQPIRTTGSKLNYATTLFDYIRRAMPFNAPKSLADDDVYALTAYVLHLNDILAADAVLDRRSIVALKMPNRDGFTTQHGLMRIDGRPDIRATACMKDCAASVRLASEIPEYARDSHGDLAAQTRRSGAAERKLATAGAATRASPADAPKDATPADLAARAGCMACHDMTKAGVGPPFNEVARRYRNQPEAATQLAHKVEQGGSGKWGSVPMPPQRVPERDLRAVIAWILDRLQ